LTFGRRTGNRSKRRDVGSWTRGAAFVLIAASFFGALIGLHSWSDQKEAAYQATPDLRTVTAAEQEGVLDPHDPTPVPDSGSSTATDF
jgi:hypothetical protein